jgi:PAS domain S-box-containing protein
MNAVHKEDSERFTKSVVESMQNMTVWDFQFRMLHRDGNVIFVHGKSKPELIQESVGEETITLTKWSGVLFDMTIQERNNQARRAEMRLLMNESMAPIFGIDCSGIIDKWNAVMCKLTGYSAEEAIGKSLVSFMSEQERGSMTMLQSSILRSTEQHMEQECVLLTKQEQTRLYLFVKCSKRHDSNGDIAGVAFVGQDVTRLKQEEEEKKAALKLADAEKGLTEWLSHEVRNPLSIATEAAEALKEDATLELESASHVDLISQSLRYIVALLSDMLDLNKCIEGKVIVHPKECNIRKEVLIPTQNMMNLRNKPVQFTAVGFVKVSLVRTSEETISLSVRDSGCGISEQHYESLFSKWEQLGSRTNGTGIGLCLCQALVRVMGGHISLNRDYNSGIEGHPVRQERPHLLGLPSCC